MNDSIRPDLSSLAVGDEICRSERTLTRTDLVRYAGASGDFNPIHYNDAAAESAGLPGVIAHGMLTMGSTIAPLLDAIGDPGAVREYSARFTKPILVPGDGSATLLIVGTVGAIDETAGTARIDLNAEVDGVKVLGRARAVIALPRTGAAGAASDAASDANGAGATA